MIGIENVNEFYTNHYLAAIVSNEVRPHLERWRTAAREDEASTPWRRLAQLQQPFFRFKEQLERQRNAATRVDAHRELAAQLLGALGYALAPVHRELSAGPLPLLGAFARGDGEPQLWILAAPSGHGAEDDLLARPLLAEQHAIVATDEALDVERAKLRQLHKHSVEELVTDAFGLEDPPRFVLVVGDGQWVLADRGKWAEQRLLRFDWEELLGRRETDTMELVTALLHRESLAPESGTSLIDTFDDSSHKHAYEVSEDLKIALRESIERIGNEAIRHRREVSKQKVFGEEIDGQELAIQCIRYMYRILFLLYIEARPELGYAPMGSEAYRLGYGFERLRDLEMVELDTPEARDGYYIHMCLDRLFRMVYEGTDAQRQQALLTTAGSPRTEDESAHHTFSMVPLRSHLFDPGRTPFLNFPFVKLRNEVLLEVIQAMSLSAPQGKGKHKRRGRISYATLGINQLGAVYEALLSFRGFFAEETLYEVKPAKVAKPNPVKDPAYFVPEGDLKQYKKNERVFDDEGNPVSYPAGSFIYRMAGRDRQKSASYYTPEVLTKCLVKYALKELLENEDGSPKHERAEDLLELTICEPAMGSAAFLNEAINQLSERYLQRRQQELGERIPHDRYLQELQRVRMYIADNNVYGVDLNPIAIELAEVSLWLNAIFAETTEHGAEVFVPWFGGQLACGNSLVGAWRKVFTKEQLDAGKTGKGVGWLDAVPERVMLGTARPKGSVYHFLLPDRGMAVYGQGNEGKPIREMCKEELGRIEGWRGEICRPLSKDDVGALVRLSDAVDKLWEKHIELFRKVRERTTDPLSVYGHEHPLAGRRGVTTTEEKDEIWKKEMASEQVRASSPYRRLKLAMDYWCALWFWPIREAELLPERDEWLADMALLLDNDVLPDLKGGADQRDLFAPTMPAEEARDLLGQVGFADVEGLVEKRPRLNKIHHLSRQHHFFHWGLEFPAVLSHDRRFDLVIGNPPWVLLNWVEADILGDAVPRFIFDRISATRAAEMRDEILIDSAVRQHYLSDYEESLGAKSYLSSPCNYHELRGLKANLYKSFLCLCWALGGGVGGYLHPEGVFEDPKAGFLRAEIYKRMRSHFQFQNELKLFPIGNRNKFGISVLNLSPNKGAVSFDVIANLFHPATVDACYSHSKQDDYVPGIKTHDGEWETAGHRSRIVSVNEVQLTKFASLFDDEGTSGIAARLPALHSKEMFRAIEIFAEQPKKLGTLEVPWQSNSTWWNEHSHQVDGTIMKKTEFAKDTSSWIVGGPHFFLCNPFFQTPRSVCETHRAYDVVDLSSIPKNYLPRTKYQPGVSLAEYRDRARRLRWAPETSYLDVYRVCASRGLSPSGSRTLQTSIIPPGVAHIDSVFSVAFEGLCTVPVVAGIWSSIPFDFFVKSTGRGDLRNDLAKRLAIPNLGSTFSALLCRSLLLNCLTEHYSELWSGCWSESFTNENWTQETLFRGHESAHIFASLTQKWDWNTPIRPELARRQSLLEIDVIVAQSLGLSLEQLCTLYRVQFPVFSGYEQNTWYDRNGRIIFTTNKNMTGVGLVRSGKRGSKNPCWEDVKHMTEESGYTGTTPITQTITDDTLPGGPREKTITYHPPWVRCDRERDYEIAWDHFARRFGLEGHS